MALCSRNSRDKVQDMVPNRKGRLQHLIVDGAGCGSQVVADAATVWQAGGRGRLKSKGEETNKSTVPAVPQVTHSSLFFFGDGDIQGDGRQTAIKTRKSV